MKDFIDNRHKENHNNVHILHVPTEKCTLCGTETPLEWHVSMFEGKVVNPRFTEDWAGFPVCKKCYDANAKGEIP